MIKNKFYLTNIVDNIATVTNKVQAKIPFLSKRFEDFYPFTNKEALIACGRDYPCLSKIVKVDYSVNQSRKIAFIHKKVLIKGTYLRLGNYFNGELVFSDKDEIFLQSGNIRKKIGNGRQPFLSDVGLIYHDRESHSIYLNGVSLIPLWDDYVSVGRPTVAGEWVYFETRKRPAPQGWEIWRFNFNTSKKEKVLDCGANPYVFKDKLFYSKWIRGKFETHFTLI